MVNFLTGVLFDAIVNICNYKESCKQDLHNSAIIVLYSADKLVGDYIHGKDIRINQKNLRIKRKRF